METDFAAFTAAVGEIQFRGARLSWQQWTRYSSRQHSTVPMGGLVGELVVDTRGLEPFWPYLWLGQWLHCGKGATMGLGRYVVESA